MVRPGAGLDGSDSIEFVWPDNSLRNVWLEVTVAANFRTGLAEPDVFYFGNRVGDTGSGTPVAAVTSTTDEVAIRNNTGSGVAITNVYDIDRNRIVQPTDVVAARNNAGVLRYLNLSTVEATTAPPPAVALHESLESAVNDLVGPIASPAVFEDIARAPAAAPLCRRGDRSGVAGPCAYPAKRAADRTPNN